MGNERLAPDGILELTNLNGLVSAIQDDPDNPDGAWLTAISENTDSSCRVSFPSPTGNPTNGASLQEFRVLVRKMGGTGTPEARIELWENGNLIREGTLQDITTDTVLNLTWNASELGTPDGSLVECRLYGKKSGGSPTKRAAIEVGAVEWKVAYDEGVEEHSGSGSISGNGTISGSVKKGAQGTGQASMSGLLAAVGIVAIFGIAGISGGGSLTTPGFKGAKDIAAISQNGILASVGKKQTSSDLAISGGGSIVAAGSSAESHFGIAAISGNGILDGLGKKKTGAAGLISGNGPVDALGKKGIADTIILSGNGSLVASGTKEEGEEHEGVASISGNGALISAGKKGASAAAEITEQGGLVSIGTKKTSGIGLISGAGSIEATGREGEIVVIDEYFVDLNICRSIEFDLDICREKTMTLAVKREFSEELEI